MSFLNLGIKKIDDTALTILDFNTSCLRDLGVMINSRIKLIGAIHKCPQLSRTAIFITFIQCLPSLL
jgi:hypothetical protein